MKTRTQVILLLLIPFVWFTGCTQKRWAPPSAAQVIQKEVNVADEAFRILDKDLDALHDELKTAERVLGKALDREVYETLKRAKRAVRNKDYEVSRELYRQTIALARDHLVDNATLIAFSHAIENISRRLDGQGPCKEAWADLMDLAVKQRLRRIVIPDFKMGPPETLIDAIDYFKQASRDFEDPRIPLQQRGVSFVLKLRYNGPESHSERYDEDPFAASSGSTGHNDAPIVPKISARFITLFDALTLVCDVTGYTFHTRDGFVMITPRSDDETVKENNGTK